MGRGWLEPRACPCACALRGSWCAENFGHGAREEAEIVAMTATPRPRFDQWLLAQTDREDPVGESGFTMAFILQSAPLSRLARNTSTSDSCSTSFPPLRPGAAGVPPAISSIRSPQRSFP